MAVKWYAILENPNTGTRVEAVAKADEIPADGLLVIETSYDSDERTVVPVLGMPDQQTPPQPAARFVDPPETIEVGVPTAFVPELFTQFGTAESYAGNESKWTFEASTGDVFTGNIVTITVAGPVTITARYNGGVYVAQIQLTAFEDVEQPPSTSVFLADFAEPDGTLLDAITTPSGHTFVDRPGVEDEMQVFGGRLYTTTPNFSNARMVGTAPPAEYDHLFTIEVISGGAQGDPGPTAGIMARVSDDFSQYYMFSYKKGFAEQEFAINGSAITQVTADMDLAPGTYQCRARIRNAYKALDLMVGTEWQEVLRVNDNSVVGGMPGIIIAGVMTTTTGVHLDSVEGVSPSADPVVDTKVEISGIPANVIESTNYPFVSKLVELDGTVVSDSDSDPGDWQHEITAGQTQATLGGANDDTLQVGPLV